VRQHSDAVLGQFDAQAAAYLSSQVHAAGPDLEWVRTRLLPALAATGRALDAGCGAGHLGFTLARGFDHVVALDPAPSMLETVAAHAAQEGLTIETRAGRADSLPFEADSFDLVATRYSAHHWLHLERSLAEMFRVLRPGGRLLVIDVLGGADALVDTYLQAMELLRDPSHIRNRSAVEWRGLLSDAGFALQEEMDWPLRLEFGSWVARMRTPVLQQQAIRTLQAVAPAEARDVLGIEEDGSFHARTGAFVAVKPS
jgi:ubiquinone/menaquinone biosynthesis C-methylase UbiE